MASQAVLESTSLGESDNDVEKTALLVVFPFVESDEEAEKIVNRGDVEAR